MNCTQCREKLDVYVLDLLTSVERFQVQKHLEVCPACSRESGEVAGCVGALRSVRGTAREEREAETALTERLEQNLWRRLDAEPLYPSPVRSAAPGLRVAALVAFSVVAAGVLAFLSAPSNKSGDSLMSINAAPIGAWTVDCGAVSGTSAAHRPVVAGSRLFSLDSRSGSDRILCLDASSGKRLWEGSRSCHGYLASRGEVVCGLCPAGGGGETDLVMFDASTGRELWSFPLDRPAAGGEYSTPQFCGSTVVAVSGGIAAGIDGSTGSLRWRTEISDRAGCTPPMICDNTIYIGTTEALFCLSAQGGEILHSVPYPERMSSLQAPQIALGGKSVVVAHRKLNNAGIVLCFDRSDNTLAWQRQTSIISSLELSGSTVLVRAGVVSGLDCATGRELWSVDAGGCGPLAPSGTTCLVVTSRGSGNLLLIDTRTGAVAGQCSIGSACAGVVTSGATAFVRDNAGLLRAINIKKTFPSAV